MSDDDSALLPSSSWVERMGWGKWYRWKKASSAISSPSLSSSVRSSSLACWPSLLGTLGAEYARVLMPGRCVVALALLSLRMLPLSVVFGVGFEAGAWTALLPPVAGMLGLYGRYVGNYSEGRLPGVTTSPGRDTDIGGCEP